MAFKKTKKEECETTLYGYIICSCISILNTSATNSSSASRENSIMLLVLNIV